MKTSKLCVLGGVFAACLAAGAETPDRFIRYAEATGEQAVDVGVRGRYGTKMEASIEWTALADMSILDAREDPNTHSRIYFAHSGNNGPITIGYGTYSWTTRGSGDSRRNCYWEIGRTYKVETEFAVTNEIVTTETVVTNLVEDLETGETNEVVETVTTTTTNDISKISYKIDGLGVGFSGLDRDLVDTGRNLYLFACNDGTPNYKAKARCYGMKIWQDDANGVRQLVRDFRPCMKNERVGLYDSVSQTIFYSFTGTDLVYDANEEVPDEFVDYVEAHGNTYVDTEVIGRSGTSCEADMEWLVLTAGGDFAFLDVRGTYGADDRFMLIHSFARKMNVGYGKFKNNVNGAREFSLGTRYTITSDLRAGSQTLVVNGETVYSATEADSYDTGRNLYLFANNRGGTVENYGSARLYRLKIWQDGVLVRDFRPCRKHGIPALYDYVEKRIFYAEQVRLSFPNDYKADGRPDYFTEYLQANGTTALDTGVRGRADTRAVSEFEWTQMRDRETETNGYLEDVLSRHERTYLGAVGGANRFYMLHEAKKLAWIGYGSLVSYPERAVTNYVETVTTNLDETVTTNLEEVVSTETIEMEAGHRYLLDVSYAAGSQTIDLDGERILDKTTAENVDAGCNIYLFAVNNGAKPVYEAPARCYNLKMWQDGTLVRDFKPCVKDGKGMLWDEVSQTLFRPVPDIPATLASVGPITGIGDAKPVSYLEYIETDGTQYIDTEIIGRDGTAAEFEMAWLVLDGDESFLGSRTSGSTDSRFFFWQKNNGRFYYGYNGVRYPDKDNPSATVANNSPNRIAIEAGRMYHAYASFAAGAQRITVDGNLIANFTESNAVAAEHPLYLFAANFGGTPLYFGRCRFRWLKIWQDGELVRNFRPVLLDSGFAALWDSVSERVFWPNTPFSAIGPVTRKFNSSTVITVR